MMRLDEIVDELLRTGILEFTASCHLCGQAIGDVAGGLCEDCWNTALEAIERRREGC